jgi:octaprenyl-diphosphate synthase
LIIDEYRKNKAQRSQMRSLTITKPDDFQPAAVNPKKSLSKSPKAENCHSDSIPIKPSHDSTGRKKTIRTPRPSRQALGSIDRRHEIRECGNHPPHGFPVALIPKLASYLIAAGGKRIRPLMTLASTSIFSGDMTRAHSLAAAVEFIHTATLLHDDVVDESTARRGQDSANLVFGNQASVLVGDFLFSRAFQLMVDDGSLDVLRILSDASAIIAQGEVMQLSTANNLSTGMGEYLEVIRAKTAALFAAACEVGPVIAGADAAATRAMAEYGLNLGIAFQIADDALDYAATQEKIGKTPGDDFREGKMTAPIILALMKASPEEMKFWTRTLGEKQQTEQDFTEASASSKNTTRSPNPSLSPTITAKRRDLPSPKRPTTPCAPYWMN